MSTTVVYVLVGLRVAGLVLAIGALALTTHSHNRLLTAWRDAMEKRATPR